MYLFEIENIQSEEFTPGTFQYSLINAQVMPPSKEACFYA